MRSVILLSLLFASPSTWASGLVTRYQFLSAQGIPQGVWTFGVNHGRSVSDGNSYASSGQQMSNQNFFSRNINYRHLLDEINDPLEKELARAAFGAYEKDNNELAGRVVNDVEVEQQANTYILGRGITRRISLLAIFPVVTVRTRFESRFVNGASLEQFAAQLRQEGQYQRADEILEKSQNALSERLRENGYRPAYPSEVTSLANVHLNLRFDAHSSNSLNIVTDSVLIVPAGKKADVDDFIPLRMNEEQYSLRQGITAAYRPTDGLGVLASTYYHKRFPFQKTRRIPLNEVSPLSSDLDPNTRIQYGDTYGLGLQINYAFSDTWMVYGGRGMEFKDRDSISGNRYASSRYEYLEKDTQQQLTLNYLGFAVNTISAFLAQKFIIPVDLNLQYAFSSAGKNTFANELIALNMMVFYK